MQTTDKFFESFKKAGMTRPALWTPAVGGPQQSADVLFRAPTRDVLSGDATSTDFSIRYPASLFPGLKRGETITVSGAPFKVRENPHSELDGTRMMALLEEV